MVSVGASSVGETLEFLAAADWTRGLMLFPSTNCVAREIFFSGKLVLLFVDFLAGERD
jgi:hypothetical protein